MFKYSSASKFAEAVLPDLFANIRNLIPVEKNFEILVMPFLRPSLVTITCQGYDDGMKYTKIVGKSVVILFVTN